MTKPTEARLHRHVAEERAALLADVRAAQDAGDRDAYAVAMARLNGWIDGIWSKANVRALNAAPTSGRWQEPNGRYLDGWAMGD